MTMISDLPQDLVENILSRVPLMTSTRKVRSTCKRWNVLSKDPDFVKHFVKGLSRLIILRSEFRVWLMSVDFRGSLDNKDDFVAPYVKQGKLTSLNNNSDPEISKVFHCNGLLLCLTKDKHRLVVWNPYLGQTRWIKPRKAFHKYDIYALGYDINKNQKVLRFLDNYATLRNPCYGYEIYDLKSSSWRVLDFTSDWEMDYYHRGLSLKGSTYFFAQEKIEWDGAGERDVTNQETFLLCFDFTRERFGPRLPLPFHSHAEETVALSSVREEQLAVLYQGDSSCLVQIWVTNRIEPNAVSWNKVFLSVDTEPLFGPHLFDFPGGSFIIDEEQKIAVIFDKDDEYIHNTAYLVGENGYYKTLDLREDRYHREKTGEYTSMPLVCSYFPTSVKIQQGARRGKRKERDY
ncbi:F-box/kelch-repeat protein At3g16740 [Raphanus sativus]|uniref:F-box/kelch-repeat protein At3g16740 n=1 Tax=Raphanus sativus TaxID=3726 RepID=A0A6J0NXS3_RAPSA|nr:F-box/kelch-repeat protein At3g16740 [Raphanus sativus]